MHRSAMLLFGLLAILAPQTYGGAPAGPDHQNSTPPPPLAPVLQDSNSAVLQRMASFLDDYKNKFKNHLGCKSGELKYTYGYSKCEEPFANGTYITSRNIEVGVQKPDIYTAVFYRYSGADAATERDRLAAILNQRLAIGDSEGRWDLKFPDDEAFDGYHYRWSGIDVFKIWVRFINDELRVSATAYLSNR